MPFCQVLAGAHTTRALIVATDVWRSLYLHVRDQVLWVVCNPLPPAVASSHTPCKGIARVVMAVEQALCALPCPSHRLKRWEFRYSSGCSLQRLNLLFSIAPACFITCLPSCDSWLLFPSPSLFLSVQWLATVMFTALSLAFLLATLPIVRSVPNWNTQYPLSPGNTLPPFSPGFPYGSQPVRGVNLGGWLVLEVRYGTSSHLEARS
jgi:hypothetical protein